MKTLMTLAILSGLGLAGGVQAQTPPPAQQSPMETPTERGQTPTFQALRSERQAGDATSGQLQTFGRTDADVLAAARRDNDTAKARCQAEAAAGRQSCLDRAERDYASRVRMQDASNTDTSMSASGAMADRPQAGMDRMDATGASDRAQVVRQQRDQSRVRCQSQDPAQRQPCLDRADKEYADQVRELDQRRHDTRR